ncbi:MAG: DUF167 domain-containing protein [Verrucomicrobiae bacterium]|nr:DUF167 domain-containing protein [Verrucomicrobiae bacterium]MCX7721849.1 DUF167 domain-containing protein [Verrucomicrobiae bacterium]MDW7980843.1 DUF167 domain-containing protein [Verrucomicrobiales bacterium]
MRLPACIRSGADGVTLAVKIQPCAAKNEICGLHGNELRVRLAARPTENAANEALIRFLSEIFQCPRDCVELVRGRASRHKLIRLTSISVVTVV